MLDRVKRLFENDELCGAVLISGYANIFYYSGFTSDDAYLIITPSERYIITDFRYFVQAKQQSPDFELLDISKGWRNVFEKISEDTVYFEEQNMTYAMYKKITSETDGKEFIPKQSVINSPRAVKDDEEIKLITQAEHIGDMAFSHILDFIKAGRTEKGVALELEMFMRKEGASALSFETIAASGVRSSMPHGTASDKVIENGDFLTLDFGCIYNGYCSDMTRTVVIGSADARQKEIYEIVLKAQTEAIASLSVGMDCAAADKVARDIIKEYGYGDNFGHALGHSVGIEIHETPVFSPKSTDVLCNGNVLSVEPGIYIDGYGGVRIEDLTAVYDGKIINLTKSPKELLVI